MSEMLSGASAATLERSLNRANHDLEQALGEVEELKRQLADQMVPLVSEAEELALWMVEQLRGKVTTLERMLAEERGADFVGSPGSPADERAYEVTKDLINGRVSQPARDQLGKALGTPIAKEDAMPAKALRLPMLEKGVRILLCLAVVLPISFARAADAPALGAQLDGMQAEVSKAIEPLPPENRVVVTKSVVHLSDFIVNLSNQLAAKSAPAEAPKEAPPK